MLIRASLRLRVWAFGLHERRLGWNATRSGSSRFSKGRKNISPHDESREREGLACAGGKRSLRLLSDHSGQYGTVIQWDLVGAEVNLGLKETSLAPRSASKSVADLNVQCVLRDFQPSPHVRDRCTGEGC